MLNQLLMILLFVALGSPAFGQTWTCTGNSPANWSCTMTPPTTPPAASPAPPDYAALMKTIADNTQKMLSMDDQILSIDTDTNQQLTALNKSWTSTLGDVAAFLGKYVAPAVVAWIAAKKL